MATNIATLTKVNISYALKFLVLLSIATAGPLVGIHSQWITGPIVNATLILAVYLVGARGALLIGILPSTIALSSGLLPAVLAPMIPFIIIGNSLLILVVDWFKNNSNYWLGLLCGASAKYFLLALTSGVVIHLIAKQALALTVSQMMSWPQFVTAVLGGVLALGVMKIMKVEYGKN